MEPPPVGKNGQHSEDVDSEPSPRTKAAAEKFLVDAIEKADARVPKSRKKPYRSFDALFRDISELSGLCAWHSRTLTGILQLVRDDRCSIKMVQRLEKPLVELFDRVMDDEFLVSVEEYKFYEGIRLENDPQHGRVDCDLIPWDLCGKLSSIRAHEWHFEPISEEIDPPAVETLGSVEESLRQWIHRVRSARTKESRFGKAMDRIMRPARRDKPYDSEGDQVQTSLGASPEEFESLLNSMKTLVGEIGGELWAYRNVTSGRHQLALTVLHDDILLELQQMPTREQSCQLPSPILAQQDQTPYQRAQALQVRVEKWVKHEKEFCELRNEIKSRVKENRRC